MKCKTPDLIWNVGHTCYRDESPLEWWYLFQLWSPHVQILSARFLFRARPVRSWSTQQQKVQHCQILKNIKNTQTRETNKKAFLLCSAILTAFLPFAIRYNILYKKLFILKWQVVYLEMTSCLSWNVFLQNSPNRSTEGPTSWAVVLHV